MAQAPHPRFIRPTISINTGGLTIERSQHVFSNWLLKPSSPESGERLYLSLCFLTSLFAFVFNNNWRLNRAVQLHTSQWAVPKDILIFSFTVIHPLFPPLLSSLYCSYSRLPVMSIKLSNAAPGISLPLSWEEYVSSQPCIGQDSRLVKLTAIFEML